MGFLDKILNKEAKKLISNVVDNMVDTVVDSARDVLNQSSGSSRPQNEDKAYTKAGAADQNEEDCCYSEAVVSKRIEKIIADNFSNCELRKEISSKEIGADDIAWNYTYGVYRDGSAVAMINILDNPNDYRKKIVLQSKAACKEHGIGYVHFLLHLPNRSSYISERLKEIIPA